MTSTFLSPFQRLFFEIFSDYELRGSGRASVTISRLLNGLLLLQVIMASSQAAELVRIDVTRDAGTFNFSAEFITNAQPEFVLNRLSDYQNFRQLNPAILESVMLKQLDSSNAQVRIVVRSCVLIFCSDITQVQIFTVGRRELRARIIPEQSDFRSGQVHWRFKPEGAGTKVSLDARLEPDFWIPPIIGIFLIKRYLKKQALTTLNAIEQLNSV